MLKASFDREQQSFFTAERFLKSEKAIDVRSNSEIKAASYCVRTGELFWVGCAIRRSGYARWVPIQTSL